jgi:hypothetical protein
MCTTIILLRSRADPGHKAELHIQVDCLYSLCGGAELNFLCAFQGQLEKPMVVIHLLSAF